MIKLKHTKKFREKAKEVKTVNTQSLQDYALYSDTTEMDMKLVNECLYANVPKEMRYKSSKEITK